MIISSFHLHVTQEVPLSTLEALRHVTQEVPLSILEPLLRATQEVLLHHATQEVLLLDAKN